MDFFSRDAGQARRAWLNALAGDAVSYVPPELRPWLGIANELNPVVSMERAGQSANALLAPETSGWGRVQATGDMLSNMAGVVAPVAAGSRGAVPAVQAAEDALMGFSTAAGVPEFMADEYGGLRVFHGSPHDFDKFSLDKIGTGEGAQAYGHGLYFAENEGIARSYRDGLSKAVNVNGVDVRYGASAADEVESAIRAAGLPSHVADNARWYINRGFSPEQYAADLANDDPEAAKIVAGILKSSDNPGRMYEVQINADPNDFLDFEAPWDAQPEAVKRHFAHLARGGRAPSGEDLAQRIESKIWAEEAAQAGIPGIRYLDAGSRGAGDGSRNYVVFDENLLSIVRKYGWAAAAPLLAPYGLTPEQAQAQYEGQM